MNVTQRWRTDRICEPWLKKGNRQQEWCEKRKLDREMTRQINHIINRIIKTMWWIKDKCLILSNNETLTGVHRWQGFKKRWQEEIRLLVQSSGSHYLHILSYNALLCLLMFQTAARADSWDRKHSLKIWYSRGTYAGSMWHCVCGINEGNARARKQVGEIWPNWIKILF